MDTTDSANNMESNDIINNNSNDIAKTVGEEKNTEEFKNEENKGNQKVKDDDERKKKKKKSKDREHGSRRHKDHKRDRERGSSRERKRSNGEKSTEADETGKDHNRSKEKRSDIRSRDRRSSDRRSSDRRRRERSADRSSRYRDRSDYRESSYRRGNSRSRSPRSRRRRHRSPSSGSSEDYRRRRRTRREDSRGRDVDNRDSKDRKEEEDAGVIRPATLKDIITANPGISMPDAIVRLNEHNTALAKGLPPPPLNAAEAARQGYYSSTGQQPQDAANAIAALSGNVPGPLGVTPEGPPETRQHRELYIGNLPPGITVPQLADFINNAFAQLGIAKDNAPKVVVSGWISPDSHYAFAELRTVEDANSALSCLNGLPVGAYALRIGRPKGYSAAGTPSANGLGAGANTGLLGGLPGTAGSNVIMGTNIPATIPDDQIKEIFSPFGELKAFNVVRNENGATKSAVMEFVFSAVVDGVITGLNALDIAGRKLAVMRIPTSSAELLLQPATSVYTPSQSIETVVDEPTPELLSLPPSPCLCLANVSTAEDLGDDELYEEILEDVSDECNKYGTVRSVIIPRTPNDLAEVEDDSAIGRIFVLFTDVAGAHSARGAISGRKFNGRIVKAFFFPDELLAQKRYTVPNSSSEEVGDEAVEELD